MNPNQQQLDQDVVNLAKSIRQVESQNNPNARGKAGEVGYYQFLPSTWASSSKKYLGRDVPLEMASKEEQNEVAYKQLKEWKDQGYNPGQIASMWNAGQGEPEAYTGQFSDGSPSKTEKFDVPGYTQKVYQEYQKTKVANQTQQGAVPGVTPPQPPKSHTTKISPVEEPKKEESVANKIANFLGFGKTVDTISSLIARGKAKEDEKQFIEKPTGKEVAGAALNVGSLFLGGGAGVSSARALGAGKLLPAIKAGLVGGAKAGATSGLARGLEENKDAVGIAKDTAIGAAIGAPIGAVIPTAIAGSRVLPAVTKTGKNIATNIIEGAENAFAKSVATSKLPRVEREVVEAGLPDNLITFVKSTTKPTQKTFKEMLDIHKKGIENPLFADKNSAKRTPANTFLNYVSEIQKKSKQAGEKLGQIARLGKNKQQDYSDTFQNFVERLNSKGVTLNPQTGKFVSTGNIPSSEMKFYNELLDEIKLVTKDSPNLTNEQAHKLRQRLFATLDSATRQGGKVGQRPYGSDVDQDVQFLRGLLADKLGGEYKTLAQQYATNEKVLSEVARVAGTTIDKISTKDRKLSEVLMRSLGNAADRPQSLIDDVLEAAQRNGIKIDKDINAQLRFADMLESLYGSTQTRSLSGQVRRGVREAGEDLVSDLAQSPTLTSAALKVGRNLIGKSESAQTKAFENFINSLSSEGKKGLIKP